ncbi:hypothetical protein [Ramlibacter albus]|uniref:Uncharacterized protein n=1 Tax=Ramlibacter albus TaxID=2079448 RepID=A0A923M6K3_9BURK|nr:hypothetical protein [Ramlibacter albus]MBC5763843.1 hypothetical protein [Ramlibacter albus]
MTPYEQWKAMCDECDAADKAHRETLNKVTAQMMPGSSGNPSMQDLDAWEAARGKYDAIRAKMDDFIAAHFGRHK